MRTQRLDEGARSGRYTELPGKAPAVSCEGAGIATIGAANVERVEASL